MHSFHVKLKRIEHSFSISLIYFLNLKLKAVHLGQPSLSLNFSQTLLFSMFKFKFRQNFKQFWTSSNKFLDKFKQVWTSLYSSIHRHHDHLSRTLLQFFFPLFRPFLLLQNIFFYLPSHGRFPSLIRKNRSTFEK